jgi:hypothetical protein
MKSLFLGLFLILASIPIFGVVNYRNGNYFQEFSDLVVSLNSGSSLIFKRSYNSASSFSGIFGKGWGSTFETTLSILPDTVIIKEMGNGKNHIFVPKGSTIEKSLEEAFQKLKNKSILKEDSFSNFKNRLMLDPHALEVELESLSKDAAAKNGDYENLSEPSQRMLVKKDQVEFWDTDGTYWKFDLAGKIKEWTHSSGLKFTPQFNQEKLVSMMSPSAFIQFERTPQNSIKLIKIGKKTSKYIMEKGELAKSTDQAGESYSYEYDQNKLSKISGKDFSESIKYSLTTGEVASVTDKSESKTDYKFYSQAHPHSVRKVEVKSPKGISATYEYEERVGKVGPYLYRRMIQKGNHKQQVIFDDCCGRPLSVQKGDKKSEYKYNEAGLPVNLVESDGSKHSWTWNDKDELLKYSNPKDVRTYTYDAFGVSLVVSKGQGSMSIKRNPQGKIVESVVTHPDGTKKQFVFGHFPDGKLMIFTTEKGKKAYLKETSPENWEIDKSKSNDLKAKLELLGWLQKYQDLARAPYPQEWMPTF